MSDPLIPYTFQDRTGTISLKELDANFTALAAAATSAPVAEFDGGSPTTIFTGGANLDAGSVT